MRILRVLFILFLLGVTITIILVVIHIKSTDRASHTTLPNGVFVELLGTTVGKAMFTTEKPWQRTARRWLPASFQNWLPAFSTAGFDSDSNSVAVFLRVITVNRAAEPPPPWSYYATEDTNGFRFPREVGFAAFDERPKSIIYALPFSAYPRQQPDFLLRLLDANGATIGTLRVPNPMHKNKRDNPTPAPSF